MQDREIQGWTLNVSVGGLRAIIEEPLDPGIDVRVFIGLTQVRECRIVWAKHEPDGSIIGVRFLQPGEAARLGA